MIEYRVKPPLDNVALNALYEDAWPAHGGFDFQPVFERSLTFVHAYDGERLIGSVYVAWDGAQHAFLLEPTVHPQYQRQGIGTELVRLVTEESRRAGCDWLHVDYEPELASFYMACGFRPTDAGLIRLSGEQQK